MGSPEPKAGDKLGRRYSFGEFTLDLERGLLLHGDDEVPLRPKSFEVLVYLVQRHGRLVAKSALIEAVWPDTAVGDNSLAQCLFDIRRALGDDSQEVIRTVARRGYVFTAPVTTPVVEFPSEPGPIQVRPSPARRSKTLFAGLAVALAGTALVIPSLRQPAQREAAYEQITNFTDSATSPALSPDGRMVAFIRGGNWWLAGDQIYVKMLPDGEPVRITSDPRGKYGPAFSPAGTRITYTVADGGAWKVIAVSPLGGKSSELLNNASGVTWLGGGRILFSEVRPVNSVHMGVVTANEDRSEMRTVYFPQEERGMVHLSYPSPDRKWALALEMNPVWQPCRVVPLDGSSRGRQVGPQGACTSAAWSPDGKWMYFGVSVRGARHLWRQRFPNGKPEQITFGPTEEEGVAVAPDGRSLITSIGLRHSALWIHDERGDRPLTSQGYVAHWEANEFLSGSRPQFSPDGKSIYYLKSDSPGGSNELWRADVESEKHEQALAGIPMLEFDISEDRKHVVYTTRSADKPVQLWISALDRRSPPLLLSSRGEDSPYFGPGGSILCRSFDGTNHYIEQISRDGSSRSRAVPSPVGNIFAISPDKSWITTAGTLPNRGGGTFAVSLAGSPAQRICNGCAVLWAPDGKFLYVLTQPPSLTDDGKTLAFPLPPGGMLPVLPRSGVALRDSSQQVPGALVIERYGFSPGPNPNVFAYVKTTVHRNLFRIPLPR